MLIDPTELAFDYVYNDIVERAIARLLATVSGLPVSDFGNGTPRPEYDFKLGELPIELKITSGVYLPVEVAKDEHRTIPSGIATSIAPYILYVSHGHGQRSTGSQPVAKMRLMPRKQLLRDIRNTPPSFYRGDTPSQDALVFYLKGPYFNNDIWLGDLPMVQSGDRWLYDAGNFIPAKTAGDKLRWIHQGYLDGDIG